MLIFFCRMCTSLLMDQFAITRANAMHYAGITMASTSIIVCIVQLILPLMTKYYSEYNLLIFMVFIPLAIGRLMYIPVGDKLQPAYPMENITIHRNSKIEILGCPVSQKWCLTQPALTASQFYIGHITCAASTALGLSLSQIILSKYLGRRPQGLYMGYMTSAGAISRIIAPVCITWLYSRYGLYLSYGSLGVVFVFTAIWLLIVRFV